MENTSSDNQVSDETQQTPQTEPTPTATEPAFTIPAEYQEKSWAKNIKSVEDLYKSYDNAQSLIGKKTIGIPDFEKATDEELKDFYSKTAPADIKDYGMDNFTDAEKEVFGNLFKENGINKKQAQNIIAKFGEYQTQFISEDGFNAELKARFGDDYKTKVTETNAFLRKHLSKEDGSLLNGMPNKLLGTMLSFASNVKKAYGVDVKSNVDNKAVENIGYTKADYDKTVLEMFNLDKQGKLTEAQRKEYTGKLQNISTSIKW